MLTFRSPYVESIVVPPAYRILLLSMDSRLRGNDVNMVPVCFPTAGAGRAAAPPCALFPGSESYSDGRI
jgi:hypothetical protein